jgi:zinc protease
MKSELTKTSLDNGLLVLLKEIHTAPIISQWLWYRVGSRDELPGMTGASHWVEHMQFKGTPLYPPGNLDKAISRDGGTWNAFTHLDWTAYYETLPTDKIQLGLRLESDRMTNSMFDLQEFESERNVIISERQGNENEPLFRLSEEVQAIAFRVHNYHHEVIGDMVDLQSMQRDQLYQHYRRFYSPNNAVLAMAGDFDTTEMLQRIHEHYGEIPSGSIPSHPVRPEPEQTGERCVFVEGPGETVYSQLAYRSPSASQDDFFALIVLDSLLSGPSNLNLFGSGISNKTSRLYQAAVEKEVAVSIAGGLQATIDPFLYTITAIVHPDRKIEELNAVIEDEISRLQDTPPRVDELHRAVKQAKALFAYGSERITNQAFWLGLTEMLGSYTWFENYLPRLAAITPEDVQRVAQVYLRPQKRVRGVYLPTGNGAAIP